jgi:hypothetical protein
MTRPSLIITQTAEPADASISQMEFDEPRHQNEFIESISRGLSDAEHGDVVPSSQLRSELKKSRAEKNMKIL